MDWKILRLINVSSAIVIILIIAALTVFLPGGTGLGFMIGLLIFWLVLYVNLKKVMVGFIDVRRKTDALRLDSDREHRRIYLKYIIIVVGLLVCILPWFMYRRYSPEDILFAVFLTIHILIATAFLNLFLSVTYLLSGRIVIDRLSIITGLVMVSLVLAFAWFYMTSRFIYATIIVIIVAFLLFTFLTGKRAIDMMKAINSKPADPRREALVKLIGLACLIALVALILFPRYLRYQSNIFTLIGLMVLLLIAANVWKFIKDVS